MKKVIIERNGTKLETQDFTNSIENYLVLSKIDPLAPRPDFIPELNESFFKSQKYSLAVVKVDNGRFLIICNVRNRGITSSADNYDLCLVNLDILIMTQSYYYQLAEMKYPENPVVTTVQEYRQDGSGGMIVGEKYERIEPFETTFKKRKRNAMSNDQYILSVFIHGKIENWRKHRELHEGLKYKEIDSKLQNLESESSYFKGKETSYGIQNTNNELFENYGILSKLQNGDKITSGDLDVIENSLRSFFKIFSNLKYQLGKHSIILTYAKGTYMHASKFVGVWSSYYGAIGVSDIENFERTLAHEMGHFIDFHLGQKVNRYYLSDDAGSVAGQIAVIFRRNMRAQQSSKYMNRTKECFARAIEQYYCIRSNRLDLVSSAHFCDVTVFEKKITPLIKELINKINRENKNQMTVSRQQRQALHGILNGLLASKK